MNSEIFIDCWLRFPSKNKFLSFCLAAMILKTKTSYSQPQIQQVFQNIIIFLSARKAPEHICKVQLGGRSSTVRAGRLNTAIPVVSNSYAVSNTNPGGKTLPVSHAGLQLSVFLSLCFVLKQWEEQTGIHLPPLSKRLVNSIHFTLLSDYISKWMQSKPMPCSFLSSLLEWAANNIHDSYILL